ncbi:MAG: hypothetical protein CME61_09830 [Halobacteriovoraceae bacterium]|nr:hypothetical protein [Halobacteriovoraceae bacterium]
MEFLEYITPDVYISTDTSKPPILLVLTADSPPPDEPKFNIVDDYHIKTFFRYYYQLMTGMKESSGGASGGASGADAGGLSDTIDGYAFCKEADEEMLGSRIKVYEWKRLINIQSELLKGSGSDFSARDYSVNHFFNYLGKALTEAGYNVNATTSESEEQERPTKKPKPTRVQRRYKTRKRKIKGGQKTKVVIKKSTNPKKKYMAIFSENGKKVKTTHFGAAGMSDYTKHKNKTRKNRYMTRHRKREHWNDYMSPGSLSRYILWNKPTLKASITDYKRRFGLEKKKN